VEPIRTMLDAGVQSDRMGERDERWINYLHEEVMDAEVELTSLLLETQINIGDFLGLRVGDVIPVNLPEVTTIFAEDVPVFRGHYGQSNGRYAVRYKTPAGRRAPLPNLDFTPEKIA
jgi:flagellar motor switch protein FliM